jgi:hypothetical protein
MTEARHRQLTRKVEQASARFYRELVRPVSSPSFFRLMMFRVARPLIKSAGDKYRDYHYYREKGWFEADYYYPASMGLPKKLAGHLFDLLGQRMAKRI